MVTTTVRCVGRSSYSSRPGYVRHWLVQKEKMEKSTRKGSFYAGARRVVRLRCFPEVFLLMRRGLKHSRDRAVTEIRLNFNSTRINTHTHTHQARYKPIPSSQAGLPVGIRNQHTSARHQAPVGILALRTSSLRARWRLRRQMSNNRFFAC